MTQALPGRAAARPPQQDVISWLDEQTGFSGRDSQTSNSAASSSESSVWEALGSGSSSQRSAHLWEDSDAVSTGSLWSRPTIQTVVRRPPTHKQPRSQQSRQLSDLPLWKSLLVDGIFKRRDLRMSVDQSRAFNLRTHKKVSSISR